MIEIEINNFQAIDSLTLKVEGFTALVGRSNIGKSSIVRALKCALSGGSGSDFVRHDPLTCARVLSGVKTCKCFASVRLTFGEGQAMLWEKGARGINRYTVWKDGTKSVYDRVGQSAELPEFLDARFAPVKLGANDALLQVSSQFDPPFLLDLSGPAVADILSDIGQLDDITQALALVAKDRRAATSTRKVRESDHVEICERLTVYADLDSHLERSRNLQAEGKRIEELTRRVELAGRLIAEVTGAAKVLRQASVAVEAKPPNPRAVLEASDKLNRASLFIERWESRVRATQSLKVAVTPRLPDGAQLMASSQRGLRLMAFEVALGERGFHVKRLQGVAGHRVPAELAQLQNLSTRLRRVTSWLERLHRLEDAHSKGACLEVLLLPESDPSSTLARELALVARLGASYERLTVEVGTAQRELDDCRKEVQSVLIEFSALGLCPTCHRGIGPEHSVHA